MNSQTDIKSNTIVEKKSGSTFSGNSLHFFQK